MNKATEIYLTLGLDKAPIIRRIAACVAANYWLEMHRYGEITANIKSMERICRRFRVGDYICALAPHYPINQRQLFEKFRDS